MEIQSVEFPVCFILCKICTVCRISDARTISKKKLSLADGTLRAGCGCLATFAWLYHRYVEIFQLQTTFCIRILIKRKSIDQGNTALPIKCSLSQFHLFLTCPESCAIQLPILFFMALQTLFSHCWQIQHSLTIKFQYVFIDSPTASTLATLLSILIKPNIQFYPLVQLK